MLENAHLHLIQSNKGSQAMGCKQCSSCGVQGPGPYVREPSEVFRWRLHGELWFEHMPWTEPGQRTAWGEENISGWIW